MVFVAHLGDATGAFGLGPDAFQTRPEIPALGSASTTFAAIVRIVRPIHMRPMVQQLIAETDASVSVSSIRARSSRT